jgi:DNA-directed RNA polymerase II subunit RPB1
MQPPKLTKLSKPAPSKLRGEGKQVPLPEPFKTTTVNVSDFGTCPPISILPDADANVGVTKKERDEILTETFKKESDLPLLTIIGSAISLYSWEQMQKIAPVRVTNVAYEGSGSVNDNRMGSVILNDPCAYCSQIDCPGHYGLIEFRTPIYNPAYIREVAAILSCVCNDCGKLLLTRSEMEEQGLLRLHYEARLTKMEEICTEKTCTTSKKEKGSKEGEIISCSKNPKFESKDIKKKGEITYQLPKQGNKEVTKDAQVQLMPISQVMTILNRISTEDAELLGFPSYSHPRNTIMRGILVPPPIARTPIYEGGNIHYDQLTHMYIAIVRKVAEIDSGKSGSVSDLYKLVLELVFKTDGKKMGMKDYVSVVERIQGKEALLRGLLMGKRVNYCGRTVAGPDPSLRFGEIRIPIVWAPVLTKKITVTDHNIKYLTTLMEKGDITQITQRKNNLRKPYNKKITYKLQIGDIVDRYLQNGDRIVNNRQPTLHRQSMMSYVVVLGHQNTIGLHLSYTTPMNCDFDGDENNAWNPQDFEVEAECEILMNVKNNIMSSEQNKPIMGLVMNSITGAFLISDDRTFINDDLFYELLQMITNKGPLATLYHRLTKYGVHPRSGRAIFSATLPDDFYYNNKGVLIMEGILISGQLKKSHVGTSHRSIIQELYKKYGSQRTADFFSDAPWILNKWLIERGFSVGISDMVNFVYNPEKGKMENKNEVVLKKELAKMYVQLDAIGGKVDDPFEEKYRMRKITQIVDNAQGIGIKLADEVLSGDNSIKVMTEKGAGTKGGVANIGQMMGAVGQQFYRRERLRATLTGGKRLLPIYDIDDESPEAHAFIPTSFFTGLSPQGLFFLQSGGREGILDTALKTAETGSMSHRMIKAFENIIIGYDGSIRNTIGTMFAPMYNSGYDIGEMIAVESLGKTDFSSFIDIKSLAEELNVERGWVPKDMNEKLIKRSNELKEKLEKIPENILDTKDDKPVKDNTMEEVIKYDSKYKITKYEKARIIGTRSTQLSNNAPHLVEMGNEMDPVKIALAEYDAGLLQLYIIRKFPDGSYQKVYPTLDNI